MMDTEVRGHDVCSHRTGLSYMLLSPGSTVAKFTGETLHSRLAASGEYKSGEYEAALKRAFLATDEDLRASAFSRRTLPYGR